MSNSVTSLCDWDRNFCVQRLPKALRELMESPRWSGLVFAGGGFIRSVVSREDVNDVDVFTTSKEAAEELAAALLDEGRRLHRTDNAITVLGIVPTVQIIHRWTFKYAPDCIQSFDFTCCRACIFYNHGRWESRADVDFYRDVAAKRLVYCSPVREEEPGGSMLRVLKYYQKGYRVPLDSLGLIIGRLVQGTDGDVEKIIKRLVEVDPQVDPNHNAHLPSTP